MSLFVCIITSGNECFQLINIGLGKYRKRTIRQESVEREGKQLDVR